MPNSKNLYSLKLNDIRVDKKETDISSEYFTVIDSGTTISYFPRNLFYKLNITLIKSNRKDVK